MFRDKNVNSIGPINAFANVSASTTDGNIISAVAGKVIVVTGAVVKCAATATTITFNSKPAGAGAAISADFANGANGGVVFPFNPDGWFKTVRGEGLTVTTGAGSTSAIQVSYILQ